jgi:CheY-like chemotaxis protein
MVLIVDDDKSVRTSLTRLLRSAGYEARAFDSAEDFLDQVGGARVAAGCVILDLHMPGMGGLDLQAIINRHEPSVPVIILSATEDAEHLAKAVAGGAARVLRKPCDPKVLLGAVAEALGRSSPPPRPLAGPARTTGHSKACCNGGADFADPDNFVLEAGRALYRPEGSVSFDEAVALIRAAIAAARRHRVPALLVDTTALTGFPSPDTFERFLAAVEWAEEAGGSVRLAMVARAEMIHPEKFGVLVAANKGLVSNIFTTEADARAWLAAHNGH